MKSRPLSVCPPPLAASRIALALLVFLLGLSCLQDDTARGEDARTVATLTRQLEELIAEDREQAGADLAPRLDDHAFARRAHLAIIGRIPTLAELTSFLADPDRQSLIDHLLHEHPGRLSHDFNWWADLLRIKDRVPGVPYNSTQAYSAWLRKAIAENRPYDEMVRELVSAQGFAGDNGAVGFYQRDRGMPLDHLANTARTFLATHLACAQCHDHPFEEWSQMDFYKLAAFSAPMQVGSLPQAKAAGIPDLFEHMTDRERVIKAQSFGRAVKLFQNALVEETDQALRLPHDYAYRDAKPKDLVEPQTPFGELVTLADGESRIDAYAHWITSPDNPRFSRLIANRLWKRIYGAGLVEPIDDFDAGRPLASPEILDTLEALMKGLEYDLLAFQRELYRLALFERRATPFDPNAGTPFPFSGPRIQRLSAEAIWDSVGILVRDDLDDTFDSSPVGPTADLERRSWENVEKSPMIELLKQSRDVQAHLDAATRTTEALRADYEKLASQEDSEAAAAWLQRLMRETDRELARYSELLSLGEGPAPGHRAGTPYLSIRRQLASIAARTFPEIRPTFVAYYYQHDPDQRRAREEDRLKEEFAAERARLQREEGTPAANLYFQTAHLKLRRSKAIRASELGNPSPETHFLRELGQSDRELINNSRRDTTIPLLLELRNGWTLRSLHNSQSSLWLNLDDAEEPKELIRRIYLQMLNREPEERELSLLSPEFDNREAGIKNTVWALLNTSEFVFAP